MGERSEETPPGCGGRVSEGRVWGWVAASGEWGQDTGVQFASFLRGIFRRVSPLKAHETKSCVWKHLVNEQASGKKLLLKKALTLPPPRGLHAITR